MDSVGKGSAVGVWAFFHVDRISRDDRPDQPLALSQLNRRITHLYAIVAHKVRDRPEFKKTWDEAEAIIRAGPVRDGETFEDVQFSAAYKRLEALITAGAKAGLFDDITPTAKDFYGQTVEKGLEP